MSGTVAVPVDSESLEKSGQKEAPPSPPKKKNYGILTCISCLKPTDTCRLITITLELLETEITGCSEKERANILPVLSVPGGLSLGGGGRLVVDGGGGQGLQCILYPFAWSEHRCEQQMSSGGRGGLRQSGIREC